MTARKTREHLTAEAEGSGGTGFQPHQARSSMMAVAGASDSDPDREDKQLIADVDGEPDEYEGNDTAGAPVYEGTVLMTLGQLRAMLAR